MSYTLVTVDTVNPACRVITLLLIEYNVNVNSNLCENKKIISGKSSRFHAYEC